MPKNLRRKTWVHAPDHGGVRIPDAVQRQTKQRLESYAEEHFAGQYVRLDVRFRGQFCYVDAYTEPEGMEAIGPPPWSTETLEEFVERLRNTPTHLCRLRYFGDEERWGFAFYTYSNDRYELSVFPSGNFVGPPEEALEASSIHLT